MIRRSRVAESEQARADGLAARISEIQQHPGSANHAELPHYQAAYRDASGNAAKNTRQPR